MRSTRSPSGSQRPGQTWADSPREIWWTVSRNYTVLFLSCDVKITKFNHYLAVVLTSLNVSIAIFQKPAIFWIWRKCWADVSNYVTQLWQADDTENFERRSWGSYGPYHGLELPNRTCCHLCQEKYSQVQDCRIPISNALENHAVALRFRPSFICLLTQDGTRVHVLSKNVWC